MVPDRIGSTVSSTSTPTHKVNDTIENGMDRQHDLGLGSLKMNGSSPSTSMDATRSTRSGQLGSERQDNVHPTIDPSTAIREGQPGVNGSNPVLGSTQGHEEDSGVLQNGSSEASRSLKRDSLVNERGTVDPFNRPNGDASE